MALGMFGDVGGQLFSSSLGKIMLFLGGLVIVGAIGFMMWWFLIYRKKFNIDVKITSERAGDKDFIILDKAALRVDRETKAKYYRLWGAKVDLPIPRFSVLQNAGKHDYLELYRKGEDEFYFLTPPIINKLQIIKSDGQLIPMAERTQKMMETDVEYWNIKRKTFNKKMFDRDSILSKILEYAPLIIISGIMLFVAYIFMDKLPGVLEALERVAAQIAKANQASVTTYG